MARLRFGPPRGGRAAGWAVWILVGAWGLWALVRLAGLERGYPLVPLLAYTPYVAAASVIPLAVAAGLRRPVASLVALLVVAVFAATVLPRAFGGGDAEGATGPILRVLSANLEFSEASPRAVAELVDELDVDVLAVQELTPGGIAGLRRAGLERTLSDTVLSPGSRASGGGIYSRLPLTPLPAGTLPGGFELPRAVVRVDGAVAVELVSVHTVPPTDWGAGRWDDDLRALPPAGEGPLRVLAGDFNATLDHDALRGLLGTGYADAADELGEGLTPTWPHGRVLPPPVTIDHMLHAEGAEAREYSVHDVPGSDHRAVFAELVLPAG